MQFSDDGLKHVLGLAWDCGAVTTSGYGSFGLGFGYRSVLGIVSTGGSSNTGFGVCDTRLFVSDTCGNVLCPLFIQHGQLLLLLALNC